MPQVGKAPTVKVKYLAAPNLAVGAVAGAALAVAGTALFLAVTARLDRQEV